MSNWRSVICSLLLAAGLLLFGSAPALANDGPPDDGDVTVWGEDYTLEEGERLEGNLVVFGGDVALEAGSRVEGSVVVWDGSADVKGNVEGDLVVSNGDIHLGDDAWVGGDVVCSWNCDLDREEGARVDGGVVEGVPMPNFRFEDRPRFSIPLPSPPAFQISGVRHVMSWALDVIRGVVAILVVATVAGLVALIWPQQMTRVGRTVVEAPGPSLGIGLLTAVVAAALIAVLALTICLSPIAALAALALGAAGLFGWIGIGVLVGERLLQALDAREIAPLWAAGLGTLLVTLVSAGLSVALCLAPLGWVLILSLGCLGLGAVVLTRFGTMAYESARPVSPSPLLPEEEIESSETEDA